MPYKKDILSQADGPGSPRIHRPVRMQGFGKEAERRPSDIEIGPSSRKIQSEELAGYA